MDSDTQYEKTMESAPDLETQNEDAQLTGRTEGDADGDLEAVGTMSVSTMVETTTSDEPETSDLASSFSAEEVDASSQPFIGRWNQLISSTNWEKGRIICDWRSNLEETGAPAVEFSDEAWARRVGGVTAPHVGRLRRVFEKFGTQYETYPGLYWSHFLAALDWDDAPLWLEGAVRSGWSISQMRSQRWEANGGGAEDEPQAADIVTSDTDEDVVLPAQGGGKEERYTDDPDGVTAGPLPEGPDFGEEEFTGEPSGAVAEAVGEDDTDNLDGPGSSSLVQPFAGLPDLPGDMSEALEMFKLSIIRHKAGGWNEIAPEVVVKVLDALKTLVTARSE